MNPTIFYRVSRLYGNGDFPHHYQYQYRRDEPFANGHKWRDVQAVGTIGELYKETLRRREDKSFEISRDELEKKRAK